MNFSWISPWGEHAPSQSAGGLGVTSLLQFLEVVVVILPALLAVAFVTVAERKTMASMQRRLGPNHVGYLGLLQAFADALKLLLKEYVSPTLANILLFFISPIITLVFSLLGYAVIPFGPGLALHDFHLGLLYFLAVSSLATYGILLAGWSANSKYAFLGSLRSTAQLISYELILTSAILLVIFVTGSFSLTVNMEAQRAVWFILPLWPIFIIFFIGSIAETNRAPFDLAEAESELVSGFMTEHAAVVFVFFFLAEYASIVLMCILTVILFLGGYLLLDPPADYFRPIWEFLFGDPSSLEPRQGPPASAPASRGAGSELATWEFSTGLTYPPKTQGSPPGSLIELAQAEASSLSKRGGAASPGAALLATHAYSLGEGCPAGGPSSLWERGGLRLRPDLAYSDSSGIEGNQVLAASYPPRGLGISLFEPYPTQPSPSIPSQESFASIASSAGALLSLREEAAACSGATGALAAYGGEAALPPLLEGEGLRPPSNQAGPRFAPRLLDAVSPAGSPGASSLGRVPAQSGIPEYSSEAEAPYSWFRACVGSEGGIRNLASAELSLGATSPSKDSSYAFQSGGGILGGPSSLRERGGLRLPEEASRPSELGGQAPPILQCSSGAGRAPAPWFEGLLYGLILGLKTSLMIFTFVWARASFPRIRFDQLMAFCWTVLLPVLFALIIFLPCLLYSLNILPLSLPLL